MDSAHTSLMPHAIGKIYVYFVRIAFYNIDPRPILLFFSLNI